MYYLHVPVCHHFLKTDHIHIYTSKQINVFAINYKTHIIINQVLITLTLLKNKFYTNKLIIFISVDKNCFFFFLVFILNKLTHRNCLCGIDSL